MAEFVPAGRLARNFSARARLATALGTSLAGLCMVAAPAAAQEACGPLTAGGTTVTCTAEGNPYADGISYVSPAPDDITVNLDDDVAVAATGGFNQGVGILSGGAATLNGPNASVSTSGNNSEAVAVSTFGDLGGPVVVNIGDVSTSGNLSQGIRAIGANDQNVTVTAGDVTTTGTADGGSFVFLQNSTGVYAVASGTGNAVVTTGDVSTVAGGAFGVYSANSFGSGSAIVNTGSVMTMGDNADGVAAQSGLGNVSVTTTGPITTAGANADGINALAPAGAITINAGGAITTTGNFNADGIYAQGSTGAVTATFTDITVGGDFSDGITATASTGNVVLTGANVTANSTSGGAINASTTDGDVTVTTTGLVSSTGRGGYGISAFSTNANARVNANNVSVVAANPEDTTTTRAAIYAEGANAEIVATGLVTSASSAEFGGSPEAVVANATTGNASATVDNVTKTGAGGAVAVTAFGNASATATGRVSSVADDAAAISVFGGDIGTVTLGTNSVVTSGGNLVTAVGFNGVTIFNGGDLSATANGFAIEAIGGPVDITNSGTLSSYILLTENDDVLTNTGTFLATTDSDFGAGDDRFVNSGMVMVLPNATAPGTVTLTGLERFGNSGTIDMANGRVGDRLVLPGAYVGTDGNLLVDVAGNGLTADTLVIGGAATGTTDVTLVRTNAPLFSNGEAVIVDAGAGTSAGAFQLAEGTQDIGFVRQGLFFDAATNNFLLTGAPNDTAVRTLSYVEGIRSLWMESADAVSAQLRGRRDALWQYGGGTPSPRSWLHIYGAVDTFNNNRDFTGFNQTARTDVGYAQDYYGGQAGIDFGGGSGEKGGFAFGITGGYLNSLQNFDGSADRIRYNVANAGVYAAYTSGNFFLNALGKYDKYWGNLSLANGFNEPDFDGDVYGARGEVGFRFGSDNFYLEPAASLSYVVTDLDDISLLGTDAIFEDADGLRGRFGGRIGGIVPIFGAKAAAYLGGNYVHEFRGEDRVRFASGAQSITLSNDRMSEYGEATVGIQVGQPDGISGFFEGHYRRSFDNSEDRFTREGAGGRAGLRIRF